MSLKDKIKQLVRPEIQALTAYHVPPASGMIKLDAMENPWPWPEELRSGWLAQLSAVELNRYPDPTARALQPVLRTVMGIPAVSGLVLGNGSDELIQMIIQTLAVPGSVVLAPEPTFVMYRQIAQVSGLHFEGVPLRRDFTLDGAALLAAVTRNRPAVIFIAYPNNPTGNLFDRAILHDLLAVAPGLVVIDEAYAPFTDASFMQELPQHENLLVLRTVSKLGLAGLRLGVLAGNLAWLEQIDKTRLPYNLGSLNQLSAHYALAHKEVFDRQAAQIRAARAELDAGLRALPGLEVFPSETNFILFRVPADAADAIHAGLRAARILIKNLHGSAPALHDCLRVTVGQPQENAAFLTALAGLLPH